MADAKNFSPWLLLGILLVGGLGIWYWSQRATPRMGDVAGPGGGAPIQSHRSFSLQAVGARDYAAGVAVPYAFMIVDDQGQTVKDFAITHEKKMHVIIVRHDLKNFQHLHPEFDEASGHFMLPEVRFPEGGTYRIFADFAPLAAQRDAHGQPLAVTVSEDVDVAGPASSAGVVDTQRRSFVTNGHAVTLATVPTSPRSGETVRLRFMVQENGRAVTTLEPYLGALGHVVVIHQGDLEYIHTHPVTEQQAADGVVEFEVVFPTAGTYKLFGQFQDKGVVLTSEFGVTVEQGVDGDHSMEGGEMMEHMMGGEMMAH